MKRLFAVGFLVGLVSVVAQAGQLGGYVGGSVGQSLKGPLAAAGGAGFGVKGDDQSYRVVGGWDLGRHVGVEATYFDGGNQRMVPVADFGFDVGFSGYSAAVIGKLPLGPFSAFVRAGALRWREKGELLTIAGPTAYSRADQSLMLGAGVGYDLHRNVSLRGEWERFDVHGAGAAARSARRDQLWLSALVRF
jgi:hypothetical protein